MVQNYNIIVKVRFPAAAAIRVGTISRHCQCSYRFLHVHDFRDFTLFPLQNTNNKYQNVPYLCIKYTYPNPNLWL